MLFDLIKAQIRAMILDIFKEMNVAIIQVATVDSYTSPNTTIDIKLPNDSTVITKKWRGTGTPSAGGNVYLIEIGGSIKQSFVIAMK